MWNKLYQNGLSVKIIKTIKSLYDQAQTCIKTSTPRVDITQGVLQGESLSPTLFSLLLADLKDFLRRHGCRGISLNHLIEICIIAYADDLILLSDSPIELKKC